MDNTRGEEPLAGILSLAETDVTANQLKLKQQNIKVPAAWCLGRGSQGRKVPGALGKER